MPIFQKSVVNKYLKTINPENIQEKYNVFKSHYNPERIENIKTSREEQYQEGFLRDIFVDCLGYKLNPDPDYNLTTEFKNLTDSKKSDGAILKDDKAICVIELKSTKTTDLEKIKIQAFNYKNNQPECRYVITSNFQKIRLYIDNATEFEQFNLFELNEETFQKLYLFFSKDSIFKNITLKLKEESLLHEENVSAKLYADYSKFKHDIYNSLVKNNPQHDKLTLFKKSQKVLDRFLFVLFAEDAGLVPPNAISKILEQWKTFRELDEPVSLYTRFVKLFHHLDTGHKYNTYELPAYNGGLFKTDELLDQLIIDDIAILDNALKLSNYDYNTEVDVNILGHIFEHSISEIEEITSKLEGNEIDRQKTRRKKEGIFYTPKYITRYIVENTLGTLCEEKKKELEIDKINPEILENPRTSRHTLTKKAKELFNQISEYRVFLLNLKILDPACGSGAFLNYALEFLITEHEKIDEIQDKITGDKLGLFNIQKSILENNLFGVDINEESVEIAKLSLWLRTAERGRKLTFLSNNIKCGNSLIDDPEFAGEKEFIWEKEFPEIFNKGGFDVVIGNPPYGAYLKQKNYLNNKFNLKRLDSYQLFTFQGINLLKTNCYLGFIIPNAWMTHKFGIDFRNRLIKYSFFKVVNFIRQVFSDANIDTTIIILNKSFNPNNYIKTATLTQPEDILTQTNYNIISQEYWTRYDKFSCSLSNKHYNLFEKIIQSSEKLEDLFFVIGGYKPYQIGYGKSIKGNFPQTSFDVKERVYHARSKIDQNYFPDLKGLNISRYYISPSNSYVKWGDWLMSPKKIEYFFKEKIIVREISGKFLHCCFDDQGFFCNDTTHLILPSNPSLDLKYLLAILNSKLIGWFFKSYYGEENDLFPKIKINELKHLPIIKIPLSKQEKFIYNSNQMLKLKPALFDLLYSFENRIKTNFQLEKISIGTNIFCEQNFVNFFNYLKNKGAKLSLFQQDELNQYYENYKSKISELNNKINNLDNEINQTVYDLYELKTEEIQIIEKTYQN